MMFRNAALCMRIGFTFDLTQLPAVAEDAMWEAIDRKDPSVVLVKRKDPFDNEL